jgi:hypothetical protein
VTSRYKGTTTAKYSASQMSEQVEVFDDVNYDDSGETGETGEEDWWSQQSQQPSSAASPPYSGQRPAGAPAGQIVIPDWPPGVEILYEDVLTGNASQTDSWNLSVLDESGDVARRCVAAAQGEAAARGSSSPGRNANAGFGVAADVFSPGKRNGNAGTNAQGTNAQATTPLTPRKANFANLKAQGYPHTLKVCTGKQLQAVVHCLTQGLTLVL